MGDIGLVGPERNLFLEARRADAYGIHDDEDMSAEEILAVVQRAKVALQISNSQERAGGHPAFGMMERTGPDLSRLEQLLRRLVDGHVYDMAELDYLHNRRDRKILERAQESAEASDEPPHIVEQHGTWAVTELGVECLVADRYFIDKDALLKEGWPLHMSGKGWVKMDEFLDAFYAARRHHYPDRFPPSYPAM